MSRAPRTFAEKIERRQRVAKWMRYTMMIVMLGGGLFTASSMMFWPPVSVVETGGTPQYPDIVPQSVARSANETFAVALAALRGMERVEIEEVQEAVHRVDAVIPTLIFRDSLVLTVRPTGPERSVIHVRSSRTNAKGDFGQNARNIRRVQEAIREELARTPPR